MPYAYRIQVRKGDILGTHVRGQTVQPFYMEGETGTATPGVVRWRNIFPPMAMAYLEKLVTDWFNFIQISELILTNTLKRLLMTSSTGRGKSETRRSWTLGLNACLVGERMSARRRVSPTLLTKRNRINFANSVIFQRLATLSKTEMPAWMELPLIPLRFRIIPPPKTAIWTLLFTSQHGRRPFISKVSVLNCCHLL